MITFKIRMGLGHFGVGVSVVTCFAPRFSLPFYSILIFETIWFVVYMDVIYRDPIDVFLSPNAQFLDLDK